MYKFLISIISKLKKNKLFADSLWSLLGNGIGKGLALIAGIFVARFLGKDIFGEYGIIRNTLLTIGIFSTFGLGYTSTKFIAEFKRSSSEKIPYFISISNKITIFFSSIMSGLLFFFADHISSTWLNAPHLGLALRILSVLIIFNAITTTQVGILSGLGKFKQIAQINSLIGILTFLFSVALTYIYDLTGALLALLIVQIINCIFNYYAVRNEVVPLKTSKIPSDYTLLKDTLTFSTPIALQEAVYSITSWLSSLLLIKYATYGDLGMYTAAMQWNAIILFIPGILRNVVLSHLSGKNNDTIGHNKILNQTIKINFIATLFPCLIVILFSNILSKSYGETFEGLGIIISLSVFTTIFTSISNVYAQAFTSMNKNWLMLIIRFMRDFFTIVFFLILLKYFKFSGVYSMIISGLVFSGLFLVICYVFYKKIKI